MDRLVLVVILTVSLYGCTSPPAQEQAEEAEPRTPLAQLEPYQLEWLDYADPVADANLALGKQELTLLAFANRGINLPGVTVTEQQLDKMQSLCGIKILQNTGDALELGTDLSLRKRLHQYASEYNRTKMPACKAFIEHAP